MSCSTMSDLTDIQILPRSCPQWFPSSVHRISAVSSRPWIYSLQRCPGSTQLIQGQSLDSRPSALHGHLLLLSFEPFSTAMASLLLWLTNLKQFASYVHHYSCSWLRSWLHCSRPFAQPFASLMARSWLWLTSTTTFHSVGPA